MAFKSVTNTRFNAKQLRQYYPEIAAQIVSELGPLQEDGEGWVQLNAWSLASATRTKLLEVLKELVDSGGHNRYTEIMQADLDKQSEQLRKQRQIKEEADATLAYYQNQGLLDTPRNAERIKAHVEKFSQGIWCRASVESAVVNQTRLGNLEWRKAEVAPAASTPKPNTEAFLWTPESGKPLPTDGTTPDMLRQASVEQIKDWTKRQEKKTIDPYKVTSKF